MYIKNNTNGKIRRYGTDKNDSLVVSEDGKCLYYKNIEENCSSRYGIYSFCDENGKIPAEKEGSHDNEYFDLSSLRQNVFGVVLNELIKEDGCQLFRGIYDARTYQNPDHSKESFMNGICTVLEYIASNVSEDCLDDFNTMFSDNMVLSQERAEKMERNIVE